MRSKGDAIEDLEATVSIATARCIKHSYPPEKVVFTSSDNGSNPRFHPGLENRPFGLLGLAVPIHNLHGWILLVVFLCLFWINF